MSSVFYKYQGAGNDFLIADNRHGDINLTPQQISALCDRRYGIGADGIMLLENAAGYGFRMVYYNSDGSGGMMCGNGGRCIVAFADRLGIKDLHFIAADGAHTASILDRSENTLTVRLKMRDVTEITAYPTEDLEGWFLDTGTRHFVKPVNGIDTYDINGEGRRIRHRAEFAPIGTNVNFIEERNDVLHVRTFEKGVEDETYACGTGITASAIAWWHFRHAPDIESAGAVTPSENPQEAYGKPVTVWIRALRDDLAVEFTPTLDGATDVYLIGPATEVAKIIMTE